MTDSVGLLPWAVGGVLIVSAASRIWPKDRNLYSVLDVAIMAAAALVPGPRLWVKIGVGVMALATAAVGYRCRNVAPRAAAITKSR